MKRRAAAPAPSRSLGQPGLSGWQERVALRGARSWAAARRRGAYQHGFSAHFVFGGASDREEWDGDIRFFGRVCIDEREPWARSSAG
jgi:hypothetical protein